METLRPSYGKMVFGLGIILVGIVMTLDRFHVVRAENILSFGLPLLVIGVGLAKIRIYRFWESFFGSLLVVGGTLYLLDTLGLVEVSIGKLWPLLLVFIGGRILAGGFRRWPGPSAGTLNELAIFGGVERRVSTPDFVGGHVAAFCGGFELDLTDAQIADEQAVIDVFAMWGGGEIKVPPTWNVVVKVLPIFGGTNDKTLHPAPQAGVQPKQLIVTGTAIMGGLEVHN